MEIAACQMPVNVSQVGFLPLMLISVTNLISECTMQTVLMVLMTIYALNVKQSIILIQLISLAINVVKRGTLCVLDAMNYSALNVTGHMMLTQTLTIFAKLRVL